MGALAWAAGIYLLVRIWSNLLIDMNSAEYGLILRQALVVATVTFAAWVLLLPLAITSNKIMMRKLRKRWVQLHRVVYLIAVLAVLHFLWLVKKDLTEPLIFAGLFGVVLAVRVVAWVREGKSSVGSKN